MKKMRQRWIAILCCVVMLVTGLYVSEPRKAEAASLTGEMEITSTSVGFILASTNANIGYINVTYSATGVVTGNDNVFTDDFIDNYMIFEGGMTKEDFKDGFEKAYLANDTTLQIRWPNRTEAFKAGWSFSIVEGAPIYHNGGESYVTLDREYTFVFQGASGENDNVVGITGYIATTYSLNTETLLPNGTEDSYTSNIGITFAETINSATESVKILDYTVYEDYLYFEDLEYSALADAGVDIIAYITANALQIAKWGTLRSTMNKGDQIIFKKNMPIYYTDNDEKACVARLDATYVYECMYDYNVQSEHNQVFDGVKVDSTNIFAMNTVSYDVTQGGTVNYSFSWSAKDSSVTMNYVYPDILTTYVAEEYLEFSGCTLAELTKDSKIMIKFYPSAQVLQIVANDISVLDINDKIILKKGMPLVWKNGDPHQALCAVLDDEYVFTVTGKTDTTLTISLTLSDTFSINTYMGLGGTENFDGYDWYYLQANCTTDTFSDVQSGTEWWLDTSVMEDYFYMSGHSYSVLSTAGAKIKAYTGAKLLRLYYPSTTMSLAEGEVIIWRKGLPVTYTTTSGKSKTVTLDKDYGFTYTSGNFVYDSSLTYDSIPQEENFTFITESCDSFQDNGTGPYKTNLYYTTNKGTATDTNSVANILNGTGEVGDTIDYIEVFGIEKGYISELGISAILYPEAPCIQFVWGENVGDWIQEGMILTFKENMPVYYSTGDVMYLAEDTSYEVTDVNGCEFTLKTYVAPLDTKEFSLVTQFGTGIKAESSTIGVLDSESSADGFLNDMQESRYEWLGGDEANYDYEYAARWVDFMGFTAEKMESYRVKIRFVLDGELQVVQIFWGESYSVMGLGSQITFKKGMPFTYTNTNGLKQSIALASDHTFEVTGSNNYNTWVYDLVDTESSGTWSVDFGNVYPVTLQSTSDETTTYYYNNINLTGDYLTYLQDNNLTRYVPVKDGALMSYLDFGNIDPAKYSEYGIGITVIKDGDAEKVQLIWGHPDKSTLTQIAEGNKIVLKAGMPLTVVGADGVSQLRYVLDRTYSFTVELDSTADGEYRIAGVVDVEKNITAGDMDGDYIQNQNDIYLLRMQLVDLLAVSDARHGDANEDAWINSVDLVRAKNKWNKEESEEMGTEAYTTIYSDCAVPTTTLAVGASIKATDIGMEETAINAGNYLRLTYYADQDIYGTFHYTSGEQEYTETFYLSAEDVQFEQFFDNYRNVAILGTTEATDKVLTDITFKNVGAEAAYFDLIKVEVATRTFENEDMIYFTNTSLKVGVDLNQGGSLTYLEDLAHAPKEYTTGRYLGNLGIGIGSVSGSNEISNVNLININDLGRQMQQSYFIAVNDDNYTPGVFNVNGTDETWPYNPVQAGDKNDHQSQVVDYRKIDTDANGSVDMIYVKVRGMDWSDSTGNGTTTESYMENWYQIKADLLYVDNTFVDWSGYTREGSTQPQELPAYYTASALNYFVEGNDIGTRTTYGDWTTSAGFSATGSEVSDWYAWVNSDSNTAYGLGIYMPGADTYVAGRPYTSTSTIYNYNKNASEAPILQLGLSYLNRETAYQNCFLSNTSYIAPTVSATLSTYKEYTYTYVLHANTLDEMTTTFSGITDVSNEQLAVW